MTKIEAQTLDEAYSKASKVLKCSISELHCEVVQYPSNGIFGLFKKSAIIIATCSEDIKTKEQERILNHEALTDNISEEDVAIEILSVVKEEYTAEDDLEEIEDIPKAEEEYFEQENVIYDELSLMIENQLKELFSHACFDIDVIEVDVRDNTALIFIDGEDAALLIGKEGYRYNALSYMIFSWLHTKYELFIKLEIAEFLTTQQEMIANYIKPVIENVERDGRGRTRFLDGILVQIALEQLREHFPNKYVAVKTSKDGKKFVVINDFNTKYNG
jgi:spoIIIJ-associated protein